MYVSKMIMDEYGMEYIKAKEIVDKYREQHSI